MSDRKAMMATFLLLAGWAKASRRPLAGDASNRRYDRLTNFDGARAVLMDAPPSKGEDVAPFIAVADYLARHGLSAPKLLARDMVEGFLLLEDLGDDLFARVLVEAPEKEETLYAAATDVLLHLHAQKPLASMTRYGPFEMAEAACLALDWYAFFAGQPVAQTERGRFRDLLQGLLEAADPGQSVMTLRDFHAENLIWLPNRHATRQVGLLDFQDAMLCHPAYDLASLLNDARRDVGDATRESCIKRYTDATRYDPAAFACGFATCSAQRNLRIMGVFARLSVRDGKKSYPDLMPRVWGNLMRDLSHPDLSEVKARIHSLLPEPTPDIIEKIKAANV